MLSDIGAGQYWIGLSDTAVEGTYVWTDGLEATYTDWGNGKPSAGNTEDCVRLMSGFGVWNDDYCRRKRAYICEFNITP